MHQNLLIVTAASVVGLATFAVLPAQEPTREIQFKTFEKGAKGLVQAVNGNTITGAPYSAEAVTETTQVLGDGNQIAHRSSVKLYRDSQGRERREESEPFQRVFIYDPVSNTNLSIDPQARTAEKSVGGSFGRGGARLANPVAGGGRNGGIPQGTMIAIPDGRLGTITVTGRMISGASTPAPVAEDLGSKSVEGVYAKGSRTTVTIPAGQIGNRAPIEVVDEVWYSPDLQMNVMTRHSDPRSGDIVYRLTNVSRAEPDPTLFQAPADFRVKESQAPGFITCKEGANGVINCSSVAP
jgi:hypothetical protein